MDILPPGKYKRTKEIKEKQSRAKRGKKLPSFTEAHKRKLSESNIGKHPCSEEHRKKISQANKNRQFSKETRELWSIQRRGKNNSQYGKFGSAHPAWKEHVGNRRLHERVRLCLPEPDLCQKCGLVPPIDLANITGIYNEDLENWQYWCRKCHLIDDGRIKNLELSRFYRSRDN